MEKKKKILVWWKILIYNVDHFSLFSSHLNHLNPKIIYFPNAPNFVKISLKSTNNSEIK